MILLPVIQPHVIGITSSNITSAFDITMHYMGCYNLHNLITQLSCGYIHDLSIAGLWIYPQYLILVTETTVTVIDHKCPGDRQIFITCDVNDRGVGAMLLFGERWEDVQPVAFYSTQFFS